MPSPLDKAVKCVSYIYVNEREPGGGWATGWEPGAEFMASIELDSSIEAQTGASTGIVGDYEVYVSKDLDFSQIKYFSRANEAVGKSDNPIVFRITTDPNDMVTPKKSRMNLKYFSAAKSALPASTSFPAVE